MNYLPTIGLEIHIELATKSKMFCSCKNDLGEKRPNTNVCSICLGQPGTLPVLNMEAISHVLKLGLAVDGKIADFTEWDRKHYFYPDIPKGYQISQYKYPLVSGGQLAGISLERIHLEEDTAKSTHDTHEKSLIDFNRSGVPLMELVTKPVIHNAAAAVAFAKELQLLMRYIGASEANMEKGQMRVEANISISPLISQIPTSLGTKTEVKNLNSFRSVESAIVYEIERQTISLSRARPITQETRGWNELKSETFSQRAKESSHDYRYFPDPDIPKLKLSEIIARSDLAKDLPELPWIKRSRFQKDFGMTAKEVEVFVNSPVIADYYESVILPYKDDAQKIKLTTNYILTDYLGLLKKENSDNVESVIGIIPSSSFSELINMLSFGDLSSRGTKELIAIMVSGPLSFQERVGVRFVSIQALANKHSLIQKSNTNELLPIIEKIITDNASIVAEYKSGKIASLQYLIGQAMKATEGSANPGVIQKLLVDRLSS